MGTALGELRASAPRVCRVALLAGPDTLIDYALPAAVPLIAVIEDLIPRVNDILGSRGVAALDDSLSYDLCRSDARPLDPQVSLDDAGVLDGDLLWLVPREATERFEPVVEEVSTALAVSARAQFSQVDEATARRVAVGLCAALLVAAEAILARLWWQVGGWAPAAVSWGLAGALAVGAWLASRARGEQRRRAADGLACVALIGATFAAAMSVPGHPGSWHLFAGIVTLLCGAALLTMATGRYVTILSALVVVLGGAGPVAAIHASGWQVRPEHIAVTVLAVMLVVVTLATNIAVVGAGIPGPWFPSRTNRRVFEHRQGAARDTVSPVPAEAESAEQIAAWARRGTQIVTGLLGGCGVVTVAAAGFAVIPGRPGGWRFLVFTAAICLIFVLRARSFVDRYQAAALVVSAVLAAAMVIGRYAMAPNPASVSAALVGVAALAGLVVAGFVAALVIPGVRISAPVNRAVEVSEYFVLVFVFPWLLWLLNVLSLVRNLVVHGS